MRLRTSRRRLRDNIDLLADVLQLGLEVSSTEVPVGDFAADIVARDLGSGRTVIIENQLQQTDHDHLGKLITYAAGLDAAIVVWIAQRIRDEHRAALDWLNGHTGEGVDLFGLEVEVLRIGGSLPAPHFKLVAQPNEWTPPSSGSSDVNRRRAEFLQAALDSLRARDPQVIPPGRVAPNAWWFSFSAGRRGFNFGWGFTTGGRFRVYLYIDPGDGEINRSLFAALIAQRQTIEDALGFGLVWDNPEAQRARVLVTYRAGTVDDPPEQRDQLREWAVSTMIKLVTVLRPIVAALQAGSPDGLTGAPDSKEPEAGFDGTEPRDKPC